MNLSTIIEFNKYLNTFDWGYIDANGKIETTDFTYYCTCTPADFLKNKCGVCWDFVNYEYTWFKEHGFKPTLNALLPGRFSTYYIESQDNTINPTHTWLAFNLDGKIYSFESSWMMIQGVKEFSSEKEMYNYYIENFRQAENVKNVSVYKYHITGIYKQTPEDFMLYCKTISHKLF